MKTFRCDHCGHPLFFENVLCLHCGSTLAFLPNRLALCAIEPVPDDTGGLWRRKRARRVKAESRQYRQCDNNVQHQACNFAVPAEDPNPLCVSCRLTRILPDLTLGENHTRWYRIETAKRRLFYTLARLRLVSVEPPSGDQGGPVFQFLQDQPGQHVLTGHSNGVITLNVAEADDEERVRRRLALHEPYRTLLGHLRHESGHYYWDRLIAGTDRLEAFRGMFGDERADYAQALQAHYAAGGMPANWQLAHVSAYATSHPWEDWAETWAHYLHMVDLMETASSYSTRVVVPGTDEDDAEEVADPFEGTSDFDHLVDQWVPLTLLVNSLNRSLGQDDAYPFALTAQALEKLRFVHDAIHQPAKPLAPAEETPEQNDTTVAAS